MKTLAYMVITIILSLSFISGCSRNGEDDVIKTSNDRDVMVKLSEGDVFLRVNGQEFTKHDYLVASSLFDKMHRMRAGDPLTGPNSKAERAKELRCEYTVSEIKRRALMAQFAKANKVVASEKNMRKAENLFLKVVGRSKKKIKDVIAEYGNEDGALLEEYLRGDALDLTLREHFDASNTLQITDADIMVVSNRIQRSRVVAAESNGCEIAILNTAITAIKAGLPFDEAAKKYSLLPEEGTEWEDFDRDDLNEVKELRQWLKGAKVGDVSGVLELDDGFSVVKLVAYDREDEDDEKGKTLVVEDGKEEEEKDDDDSPEETWTLVRICRKSWDPFEPLTRQEIVDELFRIRSGKIQKKIGEAIMANAVIEWPHGTNLFNVVVGKKTKSSK